MALQEFLTEGRNGGKCVSYKILNEQVLQFQQAASSRGVTTEKRGKGKESSTIYVCSTSSEDLNPLKDFVKEDLVVILNMRNSAKSAA